MVAWIWPHEGQARSSEGVAIFAFVWISYAFGAGFGALAHAWLSYPLLIPAAILPFIMLKRWETAPAAKP